jgi:hypothetical protein
MPGAGEERIAGQCEKTGLQGVGEVSQFPGCRTRGQIEQECQVGLGMSRHSEPMYTCIE